ncbi:50S ribosomal protein L6 [Candidatus Peregrinibacteria bacterium]|nr:50S ribosomal protein L6 [Candidatus Peregrinibacteria bacterium]
MSRIGRKPVDVPSQVQVEINGSTVKTKGPKGELVKQFQPNVEIKLEGNQIIVVRKDNSKTTRSLHGLTRNLIQNMLEGVTKGFEKKLEINGVGFRAQINKNKITLSLGFSHPVEFTAPKEIEFQFDESAKNKNIIIVTGIDKQMVGEVAAKIKKKKKPEPYKGKGIKYVGEFITRKAGKTAASK